MHVFLEIKKKIRKDGCFREITSLLNRAQAQPRLRVLFIRYLNIYIYIYIFFFSGISPSPSSSSANSGPSPSSVASREGHWVMIRALLFSTTALFAFYQFQQVRQHTKALKAKRIHPLNFNINCTTTPFWQIYKSFLA